MKDIKANMDMMMCVRKVGTIWVGVDMVSGAGRWLNVERTKPNII
jgi:hypothetical protein